MSDWTHGYVADIGYTYGYYTELNPARMRLAFLHAGLVFPECATACELGFGQGLSVNIHAAASATTWYGTDFNPAQADFAQELSAASGAAAHLYDEAFADFARRDDLPEFDYIGLHGIWSWISAENREVITDFLRRKLKVGGVLYISYNTQPGWASFAPMRHLLTEHAQRMGVTGQGIARNVDAAIEFSEKLLATKPLYGRANPSAAERIKRMKGQSRNYLAHEYFNRDWNPMHFATMAEYMESAKLNYACSAYFLDHSDAVNLTTEQQGFLKEIPDAMFRETVRDFMVNQQFRRDYWVKGARKLSGADQTRQFRDLRLILTQRRADVALMIKGALGEAKLSEAVYNPLLDVLADHKPRSLGELELALQGQRIRMPQLIQAALLLCGNGALALVQDEAVIAAATPQTQRLNAHITSKAQSGHDLMHLASPVTGGGIGLGRFQQLFLRALSEGHQEPGAWAQYVWRILQAQGQRILKDGKSLEKAEDNLAEIRGQAKAFAEHQLPMLKALRIA